ncbi:hypothetical protein [Streptomyces sp. NPDC001828]|uniref:hypothetical protein n=1 Tax=Streptomyces sp. NPDC001828 TaxID=3364615 RepID=UPI0036CB369F
MSTAELKPASGSDPGLDRASDRGQDSDPEEARTPRGGEASRDADTETATATATAADADADTVTAAATTAATMATDTAPATDAATDVDTGRDADEAADADPAADADAYADTGTAADAVEGAAPPANRLRRALTLGCVLVLLLAGAGLLFQARQLTHTPATANRALTDAPATTRVIGDVSNTLGKVFSYSGQDTSATEQAAKELLGGRAASQFASLYGELRQRAADQKLSLTTHVVRAGVTRLTRDRAELLVFLDQRAQRGTSAATTAAAQLSITAQLDDGHWQITDIRAR